MNESMSRDLLKSLLWLDEAIIRFSSNHIHDAISNLGLELDAYKGNLVDKIQ